MILLVYCYIDNDCNGNKEINRSPIGSALVKISNTYSTVVEKLCCFRQTVNPTKITYIEIITIIYDNLHFNIYMVI